MLTKTFSVLATALLLGSVSAQSSTSSSRRAATTTTSAPAATHTVSVGADGLNFFPTSLNASVGDLIEYRFYPQNHSVARAAYGQPCIPYEYTAPGRVGFWSGYRPIQIVSNDLPQFSIRINDTQPLFFYCSAPGACLEGMVGVVNPNTTQTFQAQFEFAHNATVEFGPGENQFPVEAATPRTTTTTSSAPTNTNTAPSETTSPAVVPASHPHAGLSVGAIVGIAIAGFVALVVIGVIFYMCGRQKSLSEILHRHSQAPTQTTYRPASTGVSEAQYANMVKNPNSLSVMSAPYGSNAYTETDGSYRSASPPIDEHTGMNPTAWGPGGQAIPPQGSPNSNTGAFPSPQFYHDGLHTHDPTDIKPFPTSYTAPHSEQDRNPSGPHELPAPGRHPSSVSAPSDVHSARPFSFTDSESGYVPRDTGIDDITRR